MWQDINWQVNYYEENINRLKINMENKQELMLPPAYSPLGLLCSMRVNFSWPKTIVKLHSAGLEERIRTLDNTLKSFLQIHRSDILVFIKNIFEHYCIKYNGYMQVVCELEEEYGDAFDIRDGIEAIIWMYPELKLREHPLYKKVEEGDELLRKAIPELAAKNYLWWSDEHPKEYWWQHLAKMASEKP